MSRFRIAAALLSFCLSGSMAIAADMLKPGDAFPAWELSDQLGTKVSSKTLAGKTYLLWFYPKAMTPGCTAEGEALRDNFEGFRMRGVEVLGVSFDAPKSNAEFIANEGFPFRLLSDSDHSLAVSVGAASSPSQPFARRISYLVGPDGKVLKSYDSVSPPGHAKEVLADLPAGAAGR
jgi:peroxiredoxin Q/BCP